MIHSARVMGANLCFSLLLGTCHFFPGGRTQYFCCAEGEGGGVTFVLYRLNLLNVCVLHTCSNMIQVYYDL